MDNVCYLFNEASVGHHSKYSHLLEERLWFNKLSLYRFYWGSFVLLGPEDEQGLNKAADSFFKFRFNQFLFIANSVVIIFLLFFATAIII